MEHSGWQIRNRAHNRLSEAEKLLDLSQYILILAKISLLVLPTRQNLVESDSGGLEPRQTNPSHTGTQAAAL